MNRSTGDSRLRGDVGSGCGFSSSSSSGGGSKYMGSISMYSPSRIGVPPKLRDV